MAKILRGTISPAIKNCFEAPKKRLLWTPRPDTHSTSNQSFSPIQISTRTYCDSSTDEIPSEFYYKAYGKIHGVDRCTYQGMDLVDKMLPGSEDKKDPMIHIRNPQIMDDIYPIHADYLVIGGGIMGASVAYWLSMMRTKSKVVIVEKDPAFTQAATVLSVGGIRQQFSLQENIQMSMFGAEFLRDSFRHLSVWGKEIPRLNFNPQGYLFLASEAGVPQMEEVHMLQRRLGAKVSLFSTTRLKEDFPWLNLKDVAMGSYGLENEGWFDPWSLLNGMKDKAKSEGTQIIQGDVVGFKFDYSETTYGRDRITDAMVRKKDGMIQPIKFHSLINCAGPWAADLARLAKIGTDDIDPDDVRTVRLPVERRKRFVYVVHCPDGPGLNCPMVVDTSGFYFRREGLAGHYLVGMSPDEHEEPPTDNLDVDYDFFYERIWPLLAHRVPAFEKCKVKNAWAGYYDYNFYDENGIIGNHPYYNNFYFCNGFSGHGIQMAPAAGVAVAEIVTFGSYDTLDLSRLDFRRLIVGAKMMEANMV